MQSESGYHFISSYLTCQQRFYWSYIEGLIPKRTSKHLLFGDAIHKALAQYYSDRISKDILTRRNLSIDTFRLSMENLESEYTFQEDYHNDVSRGVILLNEYFESRSLENLFVGLNVEVYRARTLLSGRVLTGNIDLIAGIGKNQVIYDHKTTGWAIPLLLQNLRMSHQTTTYLALCPEATSFIYNILHQSGNKCKFHQEIVYRTQEEIDNWLYQSDDILGEISSKVGKPQNKWWRNDKSCFSYNHICEYIDLCKNSHNHLYASQFKYRECKEV